MKQQCDLIKGLLQTYYDEELLFDEKRKVEQHLEKCDDCCLRLEALRELSEIVRMENEAVLEEVSFEGFAERIQGNIEREEERQVRHVEEEGIWERFFQPVVAFFSAHKPILATSLVTAVLVSLLLPPLLNGPVEKVIVTQPQVIVESVRYDENSSVLISSTPEEGTAVIWLLDNREISDGVPQLRNKIEKKHRELKDNPI